MKVTKVYDNEGSRAALPVCLQEQILEQGKQLEEYLDGADNDKEFEKRMNELEDKYAPKREILRKSKKMFFGVLDDYLKGALTKEKALLLLQSKRQQLSEKIKDMAIKGRFIEIDYEDGKGYMPEEFMKIANEVHYYYTITQNNIGIGNADIKKLESFSSPAVKRVIKSAGDSFDKYFGTAEKKESQPEQETRSTEKTPSTSENKNEKKDIDEILRELITEQLIKKENIKIREKEFEIYKLNKSFKDVKNFIEKKIKADIYNIKDAELFMITNLKSKKSHSLRPSLYMNKRRTNKH